MIDQRDIERLQSAGIEDIGLLIGAAADCIRRFPPEDDFSAAGSSSLSAEESEALRSVGARGFGTSSEQLNRQERSNLLAVTAEYAQMVASAYTARQAADRLGVSLGRVRQRVAERSLYAIEGPSGRVFPRFQFGSTAVLPGLERVLVAIRLEAHPIAVERFFLDPTPDLESEVVRTALCPRDWLLSGNPVEPIVELAREL